MGKVNYWKIAVILIIIWFIGGILYRVALNEGVPIPTAEGGHMLVWLLALIVGFAISFKYQLGKVGTKLLKFSGCLLLLIFMPFTLGVIIWGAIVMFNYLKVFEMRRIKKED